jgi:predicted ATP-dependent serine protease
LKIDTLGNIYMLSIKQKEEWPNDESLIISTSLATLDRALYRPIQTGIVTRVGKHPGAEKCQTKLHVINKTKKKNSIER